METCLQTELFGRGDGTDMFPGRRRGRMPSAYPERGPQAVVGPRSSLTPLKPLQTTARPLVVPPFARRSRPLFPKVLEVDVRPREHVCLATRVARIPEVRR